MENLQNLLNKFNKTRKFNVDTTNYKFVKLSSLDGMKDLQLNGYYFMNGKFGREVIAINSDNQILINTPNRYVQMFTELDESDEITKAINDGKIKFDVVKRIGKDGKTFYNIQLKCKE